MGVASVFVWIESGRCESLRVAGAVSAAAVAGALADPGAVCGGRTDAHCSRCLHPGMLHRGATPRAMPSTLSTVLG